MPKNRIPRWLELAIEFDRENLTGLPVSAFHNNGISCVYRCEGKVWKRSIPFLIENEIYCLQVMGSISSYVPKARRLDKYTIEMEDLGESEPITDREAFKLHKYGLIDAMQRCSLRHGDLTVANIIVKDNVPKVIDWAEARFARDPRPDKRTEGDYYWLDETWRKLCQK